MIPTQYPHHSNHLNMNNPMKHTNPSLRTLLLVLPLVALGLIGCESFDPAAETEGTESALALNTASATLAAAPLTDCVGTIGAITVEDIVVPDGSACTLNGTIVLGNVDVGTGSRLTARGVDVGGNIFAEGAAAVTVQNRNATRSMVDGNIQIKQGGTARVISAIIGGDLQLEQNTGLVTASRNTVGGNLQVFTNTGGVMLTSNTIEEALQCTGNDPAPTGSGNTASIKQDQCELL